MKLGLFAFSFLIPIIALSQSELPSAEPLKSILCYSFNGARQTAVAFAACQDHARVIRGLTNDKVKYEVVCQQSPAEDSECKREPGSAINFIKMTVIVSPTQQLAN